MADPKFVTDAWAQLGARLASLRVAAGFTQESFAPHTLYGRSTVANVETGRQHVRRDFWQRCDTALGTGDTLTDEYDRIECMRSEYARDLALAAPNPSSLGRAPSPHGDNRGRAVQLVTDGVPDHKTQLALAAKLGIHSELVAMLGWPNWLSMSDTVDTTLEWTWDGALIALDQEAGSAVLDRREFLTAGVGVTLAKQWADVDAPRLIPALEGGRLDLATVQKFEQRLPAMRSLDASKGGAKVRRTVDAELRLVAKLLASSRYDDHTGRKMMAIAAELGRLAGYASFDSGYHSAAERYWAAALRASHAANDLVLGANILKCMSLQAIDLNRPAEAVAIARSALAGARHAPPRVLAMLTVRLARTCAAAGEGAASEHLLAMADAAMSRADDHTSPGWATYFDRAEYSAQTASCYRLLRQPIQAEHWLASATRLQPASRTRDRATYRIWRADNVLNMKNADIEHACELTRLALPDMLASRSARNSRRLGRLYNRLYHYHRVSTVRDLLEEIDAMEIL